MIVEIDNDPVLIRSVEMRFSTAADGSDVRQELVLITLQTPDRLKVICVTPAEAVRLKDGLLMAIVAKPDPPDS